MCEDDNSQHFIVCGEHFSQLACGEQNGVPTKRLVCGAMASSGCRRHWLPAVAFDSCIRLTTAASFAAPPGDCHLCFDFGATVSNNTQHLWSATNLPLHTCTVPGSSSNGRGTQRMCGDKSEAFDRCSKSCLSCCTHAPTGRHSSPPRSPTRSPGLGTLSNPNTASHDRNGTQTTALWPTVGNS